MDIYEAVEFVRNNNLAAAVVNLQSRELYIVEYDDDPDRFADVIIWYSNDKDEEGNFSIQEFVEDVDGSESFEFIPINRNGLRALESDFDLAVQIINENKVG